jgi:parvulin-like peptidyl-prolyl isomerase
MRKLADNKRNVAIALGAFLVILIVGFAVAQGIGDDNPSDDAVAVVDGDEISQEDFDTAMLQAAKRQGLQQAPTEDNPQFTVIRDQALGDLFDIAWIQGEAEDRGIEVTDTEIQDQLQQVKNQSFKTEREYQAFLRRSGFTQEDVNLRIELQVLSTKIQEQVAEDAGEVSTEDAEKYYEANTATFQQPPQRDVRVIVNRDQAKIDQAQAQLEADDSDANWKQVASEFSTDPTSRNQGGLKRSVTAGTLPQEVDSQVFEAEEGELIGPIETPTGTYLAQVVSASDETTQPFDEVSEQIVQQLSGQRQQEFFADFLTDYREKWINVTVCAEDFLNERCDNFDGVVAECTDEQAAQTGCPPPVLSISPAGPGTILPFAPPSGQPQRPHPPGEDAAAPAVPGGIPGGIPGAVPGAAPPGAAPPGAAPPG